MEHEGEGKEAWVHQRVVMNNSTTEKHQSQYIGGLKRRLFWFILVLASLVVIGASVGGAVGGSLAAKESSVREQRRYLAVVVCSEVSSPNLDASYQCVSNVFAARFRPAQELRVMQHPPNPLAHPSFTPRTPGGNPGQYNFTKHCGFDTDGRDLIEAFVLDLDTCLALCSNWNYIQTGGDRCTSASFYADGRPPGNCWAKTGQG
jgi:hypothetical protein